MILRRGHGAHRDAIGECQQRALGAGKHLLDNHSVASIAKGTGEALMHGIESLLELGGNDNALARSKAISLNHQWSALSVHVVEGRLLIGKRAIGGGGHAGALHQLLGKKLGALHLRTLGTRAKARNARLAHGIGHAHNKRSLGTDDNHTAAMVFGKRRDGGGVVLVERDILALLRGTTVTRRDVEFAAAGRSGKLLGDCMLAAARTQKQDVDGLGLCVH